MRNIHNSIEVEFGDCDPAGIVYYPRFFHWFDATFHKWLRAHGVSHQLLSEELDIVGTGLMDVGARFVSPVRPGDILSIDARLDKVSNKSLRMNYSGRVGDRLALEGYEVRGMFVLQDNVMRAAALAPLWQRMGLDPQQPATDS